MRIVRYYPRAMVGDGGITRSVWRHAQELGRLGAEVVVAYDRDAPGDPWASVRTEPVRHRGSRWRIPLDLDRGLRGADVLVLHSAWVPHNLSAAAQARRLGVPYILEPRGAYDPAILDRHRLTKRVFWTLWERNLVRNALAVHQFFPEQRDHVERLGYRGAGLTVPNGVSPPDGVAWHGAESDYALWLGRFDPEHKGLDLLVRAVGCLPVAERPQLRLHGPDWRSRGKARVSELIRRLGLEDWVRVCEPAYGREKWEVMAGARCFVYPSRWEAFGNAPAEAAAIGVPVLATGYPLAKFLEARGAARVVDATPEGLAQGLRQAFSQDPHASQEQRRDVATELGWSRVAESWLDQTRALLEARKEA